MVAPEALNPSPEPDMERWCPTCKRWAPSAEWDEEGGYDCEVCGGHPIRLHTVCGQWVDHLDEELRESGGSPVPPE